MNQRIILKNFLYLDSQAVNGYLGSLEGGVQDKIETKNTKGTKGGVRAGVPGFRADLSGSGESSESVSLSGTDESRYERFESLGKELLDEDQWIEVASLTDLESAKVGAIIEVECDVTVPQFMKALSQLGDISDTFSTLDKLGVLGTESPKFPFGSEQVAMMTKLVGNDLAIIGEPFADDTWSVAGRIKAHNLRTDDLEGPCKIIGRVVSTLSEGEKKSLLTLQGLNFLNREQRRELEKKNVDNPANDAVVHGPCIVIHVIAVYQ